LEDLRIDVGEYIQLDIAALAEGLAYSGHDVKKDKVRTVILESQTQ